MLSNIQFWFVGINSLPQQQCTTYIFLFAQLDAQGRVLLFFRIVSAITLWFFVIPAVGYIALAVVLVILALATLIRRRIGLDRRQQLTQLKMRYPGLTKQLIATEAILGTDPWNMLETTFISSILDKAASPALYALVDRIAKLWEQVLPRDTIRRKPKKVAPAWALDIPISLFQTLIFVYIVVATELTISWNNITDVYTITSTGQFIAFLTGAGALWLVLLRTTARYVARADRQWAVKQSCSEGPCCGNSPDYKKRTMDEDKLTEAMGPAVLRVNYWNKIQEPVAASLYWELELLQPRGPGPGPGGTELRRH